jgi:hypothetical protein
VIESDISVEDPRFSKKMYNDKSKNQTIGEKENRRIGRRMFKSHNNGSSIPRLDHLREEDDNYINMKINKRQNTL